MAHTSPVPPRPPVRRLVVLLTMIAALAAGLSGALLAPSAAQAHPPTSPDPALGPDSAHIPDRCFGPGNDAGRPGACKLTPFHRSWPTIAIWGDSHAYMFIPALQRAVKGRSVNLVSFVAGSCPPTLIPVTANGRYETKCELQNVLALRWLTQHHRRDHDVKLILGSNWQGFRSAWDDIAAHNARSRTYNAFTQRMIGLSHYDTAPLYTRLRQLHLPTDVLGQAATVPDRENRDTSCTVGSAPYNPYVCDLPRRRALPHEGRTRAWLHQQMHGLVSGRLIDTTGVYCTAQVCHGRIGGIYTWYDHLHLSATRTRSMWRYLLPSILEEKKRVSAR